MGDCCTGNPCPESVATELEQPGVVNLVRTKAGAPYFGPVQFDGVMPAGVPRPEPGAFQDYNYPNCPIFRRVEFRYRPGGWCETRCSGPLEYRVCHYKQFADIVCHGHVLSPLEPLGGTKEVADLCGICLTELLKILFSGGFSLAPKLFAMAAPEKEASASQVAGFSELLKQLEPKRKSAGHVAIATRISRQCYDTIRERLGRALRMDVQAHDPESMRSGWCELEMLADDLAQLKDSGMGELAKLFERLASLTLSAPRGVSTDEAWINKAGSIIHREFSRAGE